MTLKQVRFNSTHQIFQYEAQDTSSLFNDTDFYAQYKRKSITKNKNISSPTSSSTTINKKRPIIPPLDLTNLCNQSSKLTVNTMNHTPLYYKALSTSYF
ncbi:unnamed protein product [Cunninghamella blakesleeana]